MIECKGCGAELQYEDKKAKGYSPRKDVEFCQRCFRIKHYDDLVKSYKNDFDNYDILNSVSQIDGLILWVVDLFDFESNIIAGLNRHLIDKDIILVGSKRDLLPDSLGNQKLLTFVQRRLKFHGIKVDEILFVGDHGYDGREQVLQAIDLYRKGRDVVLLGQANAGKSSLINAVSNSDVTISRYPGTTLDLITVDMDEYNIYDTPGLIREDSMQYFVNENDLKEVIPSKIKPTVFQLYKNTSFAIGGLLRLDVEIKKPSSVVFYVNKNLKVHRSSIKKADKLWENQKGDLLSPTASGEYTWINDLKSIDKDFDIVVHGLGFINIKGEVSNIKLKISENVSVITRKALL